MQVSKIRSTFLDFFKQFNHKIVSSSPLIPHNDPTLMFTNSGMVQFKNYFTGVETPQFTKAASAQKCVRAGGKHNDLENVGLTARHHTFFEMLGNFSFGDYFKEKAIYYAWKFLTETLDIEKQKLYITIYHDDEEAYQLWRKIASLSDDRIIRIATNDNFWMMGDIGPCGPCSEIFYDHGPKYQGGLPGTPEENGDRYIEIWNLVFMQYEQLADASRIMLPKPSIDTGSGLERLAAVLQGTNHNYETDLFQQIIQASKQISGNADHLTSHRVIADHIRSSSFLIADGVMPSNEGRGYVLRRIMRRAMRHIHILGCKEIMLHKLVPCLVDQMGAAYPELQRAQPVIESTLALEESRFRETLERGMKLLKTITDGMQAGDTLDGSTVFKLYDTYGFPLDLTRDVMRAQQMLVDESGFEECMKAQKVRAKAAWAGSGEKATDELWYDLHDKLGATEFLGYTLNVAQAEVKAIIVDGKSVDSALNGEAIIILNQTPFYAESGGQVGDIGWISEHQVLDVKKYLGTIFGHVVKLNKEIQVGDIVEARIDVDNRNKIRANHSATHLLHKALRDHLGSHVTQKGSIVTADKLRFDFSHAKALTSTEIEAIEQMVNVMVISNAKVDTEILTPEAAIAKGAMALFGEKYGNEVRTVSIGDSLELCGGTHVHRAGDIGLFKITSEEAIASGIRRIEALTGIAALKYVNHKQTILNSICELLKCADTVVTERVSALQTEHKLLGQKLNDLKIAQIVQQPHKTQKCGDVQLIYANLHDVAPQDLRPIATQLLAKIQNGVVLVSTIYQEKASILIMVANNLLDKIHAGEIVKQAAVAIEGKGGGNAEMAQAGGANIAGIVEVEGIVMRMLDKRKKSLSNDKKPALVAHSQ